MSIVLRQIFVSKSAKSYLSTSYLLHIFASLNITHINFLCQIKSKTKAYNHNQERLKRAKFYLKEVVIHKEKLIHVNI